MTYLPLQACDSMTGLARPKVNVWDLRGWPSHWGAK